MLQAHYKTSEHGACGNGVVKVFRLKSNRRGFTLLELIVVIVILGVLAALAVPSFTSIKTKGSATVATHNAETIVRAAMANAAADGVSLDGTYIDAAGAQTAGYSPVDGTGFVGSVTIDSQVAKIASDGTITAPAGDSASGGNGNGGGNTTYGPVTTLAAGTFPDITISQMGPAQLTSQGYLYRSFPIDFTLTGGADIEYYRANWSVNPGYRLQPVMFNSSGTEITDTNWIFGHLELMSTALKQNQNPSLDFSSDAPFFVTVLDYTNPNQAEWYQATTDVFDGASLAFRVYNGSNLLGYTNRVAVNWG